MARFERHFSGKENAKLRAKIRTVVSGDRCGTANSTAVLELAYVIAFTTLGLETLKLVAADYAQTGGEHKWTCGCHSCYQANLQALGALG